MIRQSGEEPKVIASLKHPPGRAKLVELIAAGKRFNPHVTIGVATEKYLNEMLTAPFPSFTFSPASASVYQLGVFGTARKELKALTL